MRGTKLGRGSATARFREIRDHLDFKKHNVVHSLRKYRASAVAAQGMVAMTMTGRLATPIANQS